MGLTHESVTDQADVEGFLGHDRAASISLAIVANLPAGRLHVQLGPPGIVFGGLNDGLDKGHAANGVLDLGIVQRWIILGQLAALNLGTNVVGEVHVNVGECFKVTLGMRGRRTRGCSSIGTKVTIGGAIDLHGLVDRDEERRRLSKHLEEVEKDVRTLAGRLNNRGYVDKAPSHLVEQTREQLAAAEKEAEGLRAQLRALE